MRGLVLFIVFCGLLSLVFKRPYVGILMWFWFSLLNPHRHAWGFFATGINYAFIIVVVTLGSWLLLHPEEQKMPPRDRMTFLFIAFMIWLSITSLTGLGLPEEIMKSWSAAEKMLLMTVIAYTMTNTRERFDQLVLVCALSTAYYGFAGGVFTILHGGAYRVYGADNSMTADNNDLGVALTMTLPLLFYFHYRYTQPNARWLLRALIGLTFIADLFTYSRGALLAIVAMTAVLWLRTRHKVVTGIVIAIAVIALLSLAPESWFHRMESVQNYQEVNTAERRFWLWQISWIVASKHLLTGAGFHWGWAWQWVNLQIEGSGLVPMTFPRAPHSMWFDALSSHGVIGLALFVGFFVAGALDAQWLIRQTRGDPELVWANNFARMFQVAIVGFGVGGSFVNLGMYDGFYVLIIMGAIARRIVAAELAARDRIVANPLAGALPAAAVPAAAPTAAQARLRRPLIGT